jgi:beta-N-acetylhexosaminidase
MESPVTSNTGSVGPLGPVLIGLPGTALDAQDRAQLLHPAVGGVVLFTRNFTDLAQLQRLVTEILALREPRLLVCIDQEGGRVQRLREGFTRLPPLRVLGRLYGEDQRKALDMAYRHGRVMASEMLACGIDLSFAPVLDLDRGSGIIGDRSFSADPATVCSLGGAYLAGMHDAGMRTTGKHFPGHGSVVPDSHLEDVVDERDLDEIRRSDLEPFRQLAGMLDALMIAHVVYPAVDRLPAGYSRQWLDSILRRELRYGGVVMSDDLGMHAARVAGSLRQRAERCLEAGCDLVLVCRPEDVASLLDERYAASDASAVIARLYGKPTVAAEELALAAGSGAGEWRQWQRSLERLAEDRA